MREHLTGDDLFAFFITLRTADSRHFLALEDDSDCVVLDRIIDDSACVSLAGYGKKTVLSAMSLADLYGDDMRVVALVDRDWVHFGEEPHPSRDVLYTSGYDLDAELILVDGMLERVVAPFCDLSRLRDRPDVDGSRPIEWLVNACAPLGALRRLSVVRGLHLKLRRFPIHEYISVPSGADVGRLCEVAVRRSPDAMASEAELMRDLEQELEDAEAWADYCSGHDLSAALSLLVQHHWSGSLGARTLEKVFRSASDPFVLEHTSIPDTLRSWEERKNVRILLYPDLDQS